MGGDAGHLDQLPDVLAYLKQHFPEAARSVLKDLEERGETPGVEGAGESAEVGPGPGADGGGLGEQPSEDDEEGGSKSSEAPNREDAEDAHGDSEEAGLLRWTSADAATLTRRLSGSTRLYEDPDIDEYDGIDDVGYWRREVARQDEFVARELERPTDDDAGADALSAYSLPMASSSGALTPASAGTPGTGSPRGGGSPAGSGGSPSSSASLSSPAAAMRSWGGAGAAAAGAAGARGGADEAAWDEGPAGITFAEPVTTPTKDLRRGSGASDSKPTLSRVESLSNSFIDESELEGSGPAGDEEGASGGGGGGGAAEGGGAGEGDGEPDGGGGGSAGGDIEFAMPGSSCAGEEADEEQQQRRSSGGAAGGSGGGAGLGGAEGSSGDLPGIFDAALRLGAGSRASSMDVLAGSVMGGASDVGSERGFCLGPGGASDCASPPQPDKAHRPSPLGRAGAQEGEAQQGGEQEAGEREAGEKEEGPCEGGDDGDGGLKCESSASAFGSAAAQAGGGFSFPITPPAHGADEVHEAHAERVFSTWASSHSRTTEEIADACVAADAAGGAASDDEAEGGKRGGGGGGGGGAAPLPFEAGGLDAGPPLRQASSGSAQQLNTWWEGPASSSAAADAKQAGKQPPAGAGAGAGAASPSPSSPGQSRRATASSAGSGAVVASIVALPAAGAPGQKQQQRSEGGQAVAVAEQQQEQQQEHQQQQQQQRSVARPLFSGDGDDEAFCTPEASADSVSCEGSPGGPLAAASAPAAAARADPAADAAAAEEGDAAAAAAAAAALSRQPSEQPTEAASESPAPRCVVDEAGNLLYEYDPSFIEARYEVFDLRVVHRRRRTGFEDSKEFPIRRNDLVAGRYQVMDFLGSAAFSQAVQALDVATGGLVCLKIIKNNKDYFDQSLDEIKLLRFVNAHDPNDEHHIVRLYDFFYYKEHLFLVCELLRANLYEFQKYQRDNGDEPYFTLPRIQKIATQVLQSLAFLHSLGLVHSDLKPENILIRSYSRCEVKVIDLGSSCFLTDHLSSYVQSRSYRAPEVILGLPYDARIDVWSLGCILAELATGYVLFQNDSLTTLLARLEGILGPLPGAMVARGRYSHRFYTRSRQLYDTSKRTRRYELLIPKRTSLRHRVPCGDEGFVDFLSYLLTPDPAERPTAEEALAHPWLHCHYPPIDPVAE
ncbi:hypothetical protein Rsub_07002 [Raphidocelis subcapitata]|uniref:Protein kinase domain-containing protein n=1 Tax=Raphidocelis subcapitata TaxID=307507 RepID=A0A2V0P3N6_9CHLO|nr:hypothetical protein Rsub_07002 [Raphidocelis subcapitata]|eukprot:GBF94468.1 hypothetical protein Rsub_07002 [Raphidocelis subcapitata]